ICVSAAAGDWGAVVTGAAAAVGVALTGTDAALGGGACCPTRPPAMVAVTGGKAVAAFPAATVGTATCVGAAVAYGITGRTPAVCAVAAGPATFAAEVCD